MYRYNNKINTYKKTWIICSLRAVEWWTGFRGFNMCVCECVCVARKAHPFVRIRPTRQSTRRYRHIPTTLHLNIYTLLSYRYTRTYTVIHIPHTHVRWFWNKSQVRMCDVRCLCLLEWTTHSAHSNPNGLLGSADWDDMWSVSACTHKTHTQHMPISPPPSASPTKWQREKTTRPTSRPRKLYTYILYTQWECVVRIHPIQQPERTYSVDSISNSTHPWLLLLLAWPDHQIHTSKEDSQKYFARWWWFFGRNFKMLSLLCLVRIWCALCVSIKHILTTIIIYIIYIIYIYTISSNGRKCRRWHLLRLIGIWKCPEKKQ